MHTVDVTFGLTRNSGNEVIRPTDAPLPVGVRVGERSELGIGRVARGQVVHPEVAIVPE